MNNPNLCSPRSESMTLRRNPPHFILTVLLLVMVLLTMTAYADLDGDFAASPIKSRALNWYWLNGTIENNEMDRQLTALRDSCGFSGVVPCFASNNWVTTSGFLDRFHHMMDKCDELGMRVCINDDFYFPSGSAGSTFSNYPQFCMRIITKTEKDVTGPASVQMTIPLGTLMGCVAMSNSDHSVRTDITSSASNGSLSWNAPSGSWKIMAFVTKQQSVNVNFMSAPAVQKWISLTYQRFYDAMPDHYGTTINSEFFDDVSLADVPPEYAVTWIDEFNSAFQARYGFSPVIYYPAMWYDIGARTAAARNLLFGFKVDLLAKNFGGTIAAWCAAHKVEASGHYASTSATDGWGVIDPIKFFKYTQRVGTEGNGNMNIAYKIQSSACYLYDKPLLVNQNYAWIQDFRAEQLYTLGMEAYVRGVTREYADGAQYAPQAGFMPPELSWRNPVVAAELPNYTAWTGRCQMLLEGGRHVADIALLFPIAAFLGYRTIPDIYGYSDYAAIATRLTNTLRRDFTYMHPEVLDSNCTIDPATHTINLNNRANWEKYRVFIIPGKIGNTQAGAIHASTMSKAKEFYDKGGVVICTYKLPVKSAELDQDTAVVNLSAAIFGLDPNNPGVTYTKNTNAAGGKAYYIQNINESVGGVDRLTWVLNDALPVWDVKVDAALSVSGGSFSYLHKVKDAADYYFFANSSTTTINTQVRLRGKITPQIMDPHTGAITNAVFQNSTESGEDVTVVTLKVDPIKSVFIRNATPAVLGFRGMPAKAITKGNVDVFLRTSRFSSVHLGSIPQPGAGEKLRMEIFGMGGKLVAASERDARTSGSHAMVFDIGEGAKRLSFGMYICRIKAAGFVKGISFAVMK